MKVAVIAVLLMTFAVSCAFATFGVPYQDDEGENIFLTITRTDLVTGWWTWKFDILNNEPAELDWFTAGFAVKEITPGYSASGHYRNWNSSLGAGIFDPDPNTLTVFEGDESIVWTKNGLVGASGTAWFSYDTDLPFVATADYQARDGRISGDWDNIEAPVPEPSSLLALAAGLPALAGLAIRRKHCA